MGKILLTNFFSSLNKGDGAIVECQIKMLKHFCPTHEVIVQSWTPLIDATRLGCRTVGPFFNIVSEQHPEWSRKRQLAFTASLFARTLINARWARHGRPPLFEVPADCVEAFDALRSADLVISVGGGFLYAYTGRNCFSFLKHCHQLLMAQLLGKPVIIWAQSLGPLASPKFRPLLRRIVNRSQRVLVREEWSLEFLNALGADMKRVSVTADSAFLLEPAPPEFGDGWLARAGLPCGKPRVGFTVRGWEYPNSHDAERRSSAYVDVIAQAADWIVETWDADVVFLAQVISQDQDDRICAQAIVEQVKHADRIVCAGDDLMPGELKSIYGRLDLFVGTRMHSNIFAMAMATPCLAISYQPKTDGIMAMLGMDRWTIAIDDVTFESLTSRLSDLWKNRNDVCRDLEIEVPKLQARAIDDIEHVLIELGFCNERLAPPACQPINDSALAPLAPSTS